jgi:hypothetical protein
MRAAWLVLFLVATVGLVAQGKAQSNPANPPALRGDTIQLVSVETVNGGPVRRGQPVPMVVSIRYTLASHDDAVLSISTAQFRDPKHCAGREELVTASEMVVNRGSGVVSIPITWPGDTGEQSKGHVYGSGSLSFMGMFWVNYNGHTMPDPASSRFGTFAFYHDYCAAF